MSFTASDVKSLRERTGCGMMECKKALTESNGDMDKAIAYLREKGLAAAAKKAGRIAAEGVVFSKSENDKGVIVEINSETDFVAKNQQFTEFVEVVANTILENCPASVDELLKLKAYNLDILVEELLREKILTIGENISIRRFVCETGKTVSYIHGQGTHAVLVKFEASSINDNDSFVSLGKDIAMHIAACNPRYLAREQVSQEEIDKEKEILMAQAINEGKPANIAEKMVEGRIKKFYKEFCLLEQDFVKNPDYTVSKYIDEQSKSIGELKLISFVRYEVGEGIEKKDSNFADEVAKLIK